jgi:hypothetical protein
MKDKGAVFSNFVETDKIHEALQRKSACFAQKSKAWTRETLGEHCAALWNAARLPLPSSGLRQRVGAFRC